MTTYFFDTSSLQHRYFKSDKSRSIRRIISDKRNRCLILDLTIVEIPSAMANKCRQNSLNSRVYDKCISNFWADISSNGPIEVIDLGKREILRAQHLIRYAGVIKRRKISSCDALIAASCLEYALEKRIEVTFCLEDRKLYNIIKEINAYNQVLKFRYIGPNR